MSLLNPPPIGGRFAPLPGGGPPPPGGGPPLPGGGPPPPRGGPLLPRPPLVASSFFKTSSPSMISSTFSRPLRLSAAETRAIAAERCAGVISFRLMPPRGTNPVGEIGPACPLLFVVEGIQDALPLLLAERGEKGIRGAHHLCCRCLRRGGCHRQPDRRQCADGAKHFHRKNVHPDLLVIHHAHGFLGFGRSFGIPPAFVYLDGRDFPPVAYLKAN